MNTRIKILMIILVCFFIFTPTVNAQEYVPISNVPQLTPDGNVPPIETYLSNIFAFVLGIAALLSVVQIVIGGITYMTSDVVSSVSDARDRIKSAILGLLLILSTFIILNQINPDIKFIRFGSTTTGDINLPPE